MSTQSSSHQHGALSPVYYLHIPKTGGQTLATRLAAAFPLEKTDILGPTLRYPDGVGELGRILMERDFVERHVTGPVLMDLSGADILTTIREPVSQIVSNYLHIRRAPENRLNKVATMMSPSDFFAQFGDFLGNAQSRYLVNAFFPKEVDPDPLRTLSARIFEALDKIRWVVPTESINDFVALWALEVRRSLRAAERNINVARRDDQYGRLIELVRSMPELYSVDLLLWQTARQRFLEYRENVLGNVERVGAQDDSSRAYWNHGSGIWLRNGWYAPQVGTPVGTAWWAGPGQYSEVTYVRAANERFVQFSVVVVNGVDHSRIVAVARDRITRLPAVARLNEVGCDFWIDLGEEPACGSFWLWVPEVWAAVLIDGTVADTDRKSFATCNWGTTSESPCPSDEGARDEVTRQPMLMSRRTARGTTGSISDGRPSMTGKEPG